MESLVTVDRSVDAVATLTLDNPSRRNALSVAMRDAVSDTLDSLVSDESLKVLVITGAPPVFCAGFDLKEFERAASDDAFAKNLWASADRFHRVIPRFPLPTIAAVEGGAHAGGFDLATMCDLRVAARGARFARPEREWSDVLYTLVHDLVGGSRARELSMAPCNMSAEEAAAIGLVNRLCEPGTACDTALAWAQEIATAPRVALHNTKTKAIKRMGLAGDAATLEI